MTFGNRPTVCVKEECVNNGISCPMRVECMVLPYADHSAFRDSRPTGGGCVPAVKGEAAARGSWERAVTLAIGNFHASKTHVSAVCVEKHKKRGVCLYGIKCCNIGIPGNVVIGFIPACENVARSRRGGRGRRGAALCYNLELKRSPIPVKKFDSIYLFVGLQVAISILTLRDCTLNKPN